MVVLNTEKCCRCCLAIGRRLKSMIESSTLEAYKTILIGVIDPEVELGAYLICQMCQDLLTSSVEFREICKKSHEQIENSFVNLKTEKSDVREPSFVQVMRPEQIDVDTIPVDDDQKTIKSEPQTDNEEFSDMGGDDHQRDSDVSLPDEAEPEKNRVTRTRKKKVKPKKRLKKEQSLSPAAEPVAKIDQNAGIWADNSDTEVKLERTPADEGDYYCIICDKNFTDLVCLQYHRRKKHNSKQYRMKKKCLLCPQEDLDNYERHLEICHPEFQPNKCKQCPQAFQNYRDLKTHTNAHFTGNKFKCFGCNLFCKSSLFLRTHISNTNHGGVMKNGHLVKHAYNCPFCGLQFELLKPLSEHVKSSHPEDLQRKFYPCYHCKQIFLTQERRQNDWKSVCAARKKSVDSTFINQTPQFPCSYCGEAYFIEDELDCHTVADHLEAKPRYFCNICNIKFRVAKELKKHNNQYHKAIMKKDSEQFMCAECGKFFPSRCLLKRHSIIHNDVRPWECTVEGCNSRFKSRDVLKSHLSTAHVTEKKYECHECQKKFKSRMFIKGHLYAHFPSLRKFVCDHCGERFSSALRRKRHLRSHTGEKLFKCHLCHKSYAFRTGLQQHIQSNHTTIRYECKYCDKKLAGKRSMWKHIFVHRGYFPFYCPVCNYGCYPKELMRRHMKNKHQMEYNEKLHGYHKESFDDVIVSGIKVNEENASNFRPNQINLNTDINYLSYMTMENNVADEAPKPSTSSKNTVAENMGPQVQPQVQAPYLMEYKHEF